MGGGNDFRDQQGIKVAQDAGNLQARSDVRYENLYNQFSEREKQANTNSAAERANLSGLLTGMYNQYNVGANNPYGSSTSGSSGGEAPESGDSGGGGTSAPAPDPYAGIISGFNDFAQNGGVDLGALNESLGYFRPLASTGGVTPEQQAMYDSISKQFGDLASHPFDTSGINDSIGQLRNFSTTGGYDPTQLQQVKSDINNIRNMQTMTPEQLAAYRQQISNIGNFQPTQGYSDADLSGIRGDIQQMRDYSTTGGLSADDIAKYRGTGYAEFANNGGLSDSAIANIRARATSGVPAIYANLSDDMARRASLQGGYTPGYSASRAAMARDSARQLSDAQRNAEVDIADQVRQGREFGIAGQAQQEASLQDLLSKNKQFGMQGASSAQLSLMDILRQQAAQQDTTRLGAQESAVNLGTSLDFGNADRRLNQLTAAAQGEGSLAADMAGNRLTAANNAASQGLNLANSENQARIAALTGQSTQGLNLLNATNQAKIAGAQGVQQTNKDAQSLVQQGRQFGLQGLYQVQQAQQAAAEAAAARSAASSAASDASSYQWAQFNAAQQKYALSGLADLYTAQPGELNSADNALLRSMQQQDAMNLGYLGAQIPPGDNGGTNWWGVALQGAAAAAPYVAMAASDRNMKDNIKPAEIDAVDIISKIPVSTWNYKYDDITHIGPMAQDFKAESGFGTEVGIPFVDYNGLMMLAIQQLTAKVKELEARLGDAV